MDGSVYVLQVCVCGGMYQYVLKAVEQSLYDDQRYRGREDAAVSYCMRLRYNIASLP